MWVDAGFDPDAFWHQSPQTFQLTMEGVRKRAEREAQEGLSQAWGIAALTATAMNGKLKPLKHYQPKRKVQSAAEMLAYFQAVGRNSNMKIRRIEYAN